MYHSFIEMEKGRVPRIYLFRVLCSNACTKHRFMTSMTCANAWCNFEQDVIDATMIDQWHDRPRS